MAADSGEVSDRCLSLLEEVKDLLSNRSPATEQRENAPKQQQEQQQGTSSDRNAAVLSNFRSMFSRPSTSVYTCSSTTSRPPSSSLQPSRPPKKKKKFGFFQARETWTHEFFCLESCTCEVAPSREKKLALQNAGLGRKKIVFSCKADAFELKRDLEKVYPKLKEGGGFELMRSGSPSNRLHMIQPPSSGYTVPFLRDSAGLGQALAYIRPMQVDLDMGLMQLEAEASSAPVINTPMIKCIFCEEEIATTAFRQHQAGCKGRITGKTGSIENGQASTSEGDLMENCFNCGESFHWSELGNHLHTCGANDEPNSCGNPSTTSGTRKENCDMSGNPSTRHAPNTSASPRDSRPSAISSGPLNISPSSRYVNSGKSTTGSSSCVLRSSTGASNEGTTGHCSPHSTSSDIHLLKEIFPENEVTYLQQVLENCGTVTDAVAEIFGDKDTTSPTHGSLQDLHGIFPDAGGEKERSLESPENVIAQFRSKTIKSGTQLIDFDRMHRSMLQQLMRLYKEPTLDIRKSPDISFTGEIAADVGGPTKEFFHSAIEALMKMDPLFRVQLFTGEQGHCVPICNMDVLSSGCFEMVGKLLAHSFLHGGTGLVGLAPAVVKYLTCGSVVEAQDLEVTGENAVQNLNENERDKIEELMVRHGLTDLPLTDENKDKAVQDIIVGEVLVTRTTPLDSIFSGLNAVGVGNLLRVKPSISKFLFPTLEDVTVDITVMRSKLQLCISQEKDTEEKTKAFDWFLQFLDECDKLEDEQTGKPLLHTMLVFITGCQTLQSVDKLRIMFNNDHKKSLLESDSCFNRVHLPLCHNTYQEFYDACFTSLKFGAKGYGRF